MKNFLRYIRFILVILIFIVFNLILLYSLREEKQTEEPLKPKIVLISHVYSNPYWQFVKLGAERAARERNAVIEFVGPDNASVDEGIRFMNMAYSAKVSGIIAYVQDEERYKPVIDKVINGGIPVVTVDSDAENSKRLAYVGTDNVAAGTVGAKEMIYQIGTEGQVGVIMGGRNVKNQVERLKGFTDYISENSKIIISEVESSDSYLLESELAAKKILMNNWDIRALFCTSALDGEGAAKAVSGLGLSGKVKIICFDDLPATLDGIKNEIITSTVVQRPSTMGYKAVNIVMDLLEGKDARGIFYTDVFVLRKENLYEYLKEQGDNNSEK